eukprot:TRINITY_DN116_c0_g1_i4.p1 TRINITY_DN116_c0_g1~~TRINITY_DN116_c0_g1_i4.p1  ORF type:complete len:707 (-),score=118.16 TRINITY_DN116_c0_g1_i4:156-2276(-)
MEATKFAGTLVVNLLSGTNLPNEDTFGASDPYVIVSLTQNEKKFFEVRTHTIMDNLNPIWKAHILRHVSGTSDAPLELKFVIYDEDDVGSDDLLGICTYSLRPVKFTQTLTLPVLDKKGKPVSTKGTINVSVSYLPDHLLYRKHCQSVYSFPNGKEAKTVLGPVLYFRGVNATENTYTVAILAVFEGDGGDTPLLTITPSPVKDNVEVVNLLNFNNYHVWRYTFAIERSPESVSVNYSFNNQKNVFEIPAINEPPRSVFISCNGFHEEPEGLKNDKYHMWKFINGNHINNDDMVGPYHLLLQGGDQVYADPIFHNVTALKGYEAGDEAAISLEIDDFFKEEVETYYMNLYINSWSVPLIAQAFASIPSVMMWDDHDIFDGWGSYSEALLNCPAYSTIYQFAEKYFCAFQLASTLEEINSKKLLSSLPGPHKGKSQVYLIDHTAIVALDLRTERLVNRVCSDETYQCFRDWMKQNHTVDHMYLLLSIPIVYNNFDILEKAIACTGLGKELEDDLKDHWRTADHNEERLKLIKLLIEDAETYKYRITILSGDVHIGCAGVIYDKARKRKSNAAIINCLISSAVVNIPPPPSVTQILELTGGEIERVPAGNEAGWNLKTGLYRFHHDSRKHRYIPGRNFLELLQNDVKGILCRWFSEGQENDPYELYIQPYAEGNSNDLRLMVDDSKYITQGLVNLITLPASVVQGWFS